MNRSIPAIVAGGFGRGRPPPAPGRWTGGPDGAGRPSCGRTRPLADGITRARWSSFPRLWHGRVAGPARGAGKMAGLLEDRGGRGQTRPFHPRRGTDAWPHERAASPRARRAIRAAQGDGRDQRRIQPPPGRWRLVIGANDVTKPGGALESGIPRSTAWPILNVDQARSGLEKNDGGLSGVKDSAATGQFCRLGADASGSAGLIRCYRPFSDFS